MLRLITVSLCLVLLMGPGIAASAPKRGFGPPPGKEAAGSEEMPVAGQKPEVAEIKGLIKKGRDFEGNQQGHSALRAYQEALQLSQKALGPEHPLTAACMAHLARINARLGFFDQAQAMAQQSLRIREKALGPEHPQTAHSLLILGFLYGQIGVHDQALLLTQQGLRISEKALGPEDPQTATALNNLAMLYSQMGAYDQALPLARRAAQIREKVLGLDSLWTAGSLKNLGFLFLLKKDYSQAESCFQRAQRHQGEQGMVELYLATGRYEEALNLMPRLALHGAWNPPQYQAQFDTQKGLALKGLGRREEAYAALLEAVKNIEGLRARTPGERTSFFEAGIISPYFRAYRGMVELLAEIAQKGDPVPPGLQAYGPDPGAAAFYFAESIKARSLLEALAAGAARVRPQLPADLAAKEKSLQERLSALEAQRLESLLARGTRSADRRDQPAVEFQLKMEALLKEQQQLVEELRRRQPRYAALAYPQPYKAQELPLKPGEVLLEYALGEKESFVFRVEPGGKPRFFGWPWGRRPWKSVWAACWPPSGKAPYAGKT